MLKLTDAEFTRLTTYLKANYGIDLSKKRTLIETRLNNTMIEKGYANFTEFFDKVLTPNPSDEFTILINKLTTNHTYFMREQEHFTFFKEKVMPFLENTKKEKDLRIWSAGCSSGEEPYTLAIIIAEYLGAQKNMWDRKILATDISMNVLEKAKAGIYTAESVASLPPDWQKKYFKKLDEQRYQVVDEIRQQVIFKRLNLMEDFTFKKPMDVIFCRNVMIYFDSPTKERLVNKYYKVTASNGFLFIGHAETINKSTTDYRYLMPAIYQK